jgi:phage-related tail fiber protein
MTTAPAGFLKANGAAVSRSTYADLFAAIGTTYGAGDGSTTFNLPDLRGEFLRGWDDGRAVDTGRAFGTAQLDQMQRITGQARARRASDAIGGQQGALFDAGVVSNARVASGTANGQLIGFDSSLSPNARTSATTDGETRSRNVALLACIKF